MISRIQPGGVSRSRSASNYYMKLASLKRGNICRPVQTTRPSFSLRKNEAAPIHLLQEFIQASTRAENARMSQTFGSGDTPYLVHLQALLVYKAIANRKEGYEIEAQFDCG
jgi:hypothetical protein